jgi:hypothetical protein
MPGTATWWGGQTAQRTPLNARHHHDDPLVLYGRNGFQRAKGQLEVGRERATGLHALPVDEYEHLRRGHRHASRSSRYQTDRTRRRALRGSRAWRAGRPVVSLDSLPMPI